MKILLVIFTVLLAITSPASYADNYDTARKIMQADKEVRDYQAAKSGGYGYIYDDHSTGDLVLRVITIIVVVGFIGLAVFSWISGQVSNYRQAEKEATKDFTDEEKIAYEKWNHRRWLKIKTIAWSMVFISIFLVIYLNRDILKIEKPRVILQEGGSCSLNSDCFGTLECIKGLCADPSKCSIDSDCSGNTNTCINNKCVLKLVGKGGVCSLHQDCDTGLYCSSSTCVSRK
jgi:hypothetical protein